METENKSTGLDQGSEMKLMLIRYATHVESIRTDNPMLELNRVIQKTPDSVLSVIYDGQIIYNKKL
jgi:hypothetical protein